MSNDYSKYSFFYQNISGQQVVGTGTGDTTLVTGKTNYTIFIQKYSVTITTSSAAITWSLEDSASTPVSISGSLPASVAPAEFEQDYGPEGVALTADKNFVLNVSAAGAAGHVTWTGYLKLTGVAAA